MKERNLNTPAPRGGVVASGCQKIKNHAFRARVCWRVIAPGGVGVDFLGNRPSWATR